MKSWFVLLLLSATILFAADAEYRLLVLPAWTDSACPPPNPIQIHSTPEYGVVEGMERDALIAMHKLDTCRQVHCMIPATQSHQFSFMLLLRQTKLDSVCYTRAEILDASTFKSLKVWEPIDTTAAWLSAVDTLLRTTVHSRLTNTKAYKDSVILARAKQSPVTKLPALFQRLLNFDVQGEALIAIQPFQSDLDSIAIRKLGYHPGVMAAEYGVTQIRKDKRFQLSEVSKAQYMIEGQVIMTTGQHRILARVTNTKTGEIVTAAVGFTRANQNEDLYRSSVGEHATSTGATFRSFVAPGWGQFYTNHPTHGKIFATLAVVSLGYLTLRVIDYNDKADQLEPYLDRKASTVKDGESEKDWARRANKAVDNRNRAADQLNIALGGVGIVWVLNLVDAYWLGEASARAIRPDYFTVTPVVLPNQFGMNASLSF